MSGGPDTRAPLQAPLRIGITCYPTFGGSGVVATEIGLAMARRGHRVHFICSDLPVRLDFHPNIHFHEVSAREYPLLPQSQYSLALASKLVEVARFEGLDVLHMHYAVPHAASAFLARSVLGAAAPPVVTTLHGTDITLVGADPSYLPITKHAIEQSTALTAPSEFLKRATYERLRVSSDVPIQVIPNFVDTERFVPPAGGRDPRVFAPVCPRCDPALDEAPVLAHVSNFRPVKRIPDVVETFAKVAAERPARLLMIGDGPARSRAEQQVRQLGLQCQVSFVGKQERFAELLGHASAFLMPSETEAFGLAALEAMACGVPVVASRVGGLPELIEHGDNGFLAPLGDTTSMAQSVLRLLDDPAEAARVSTRARTTALERFRESPMVDRYESVYRGLVG